eukprot:7939285-Pyramimonas_sp.AAC.1
MRATPKGGAVRTVCVAPPDGLQAAIDAEPPLRGPLGLHSQVHVHALCICARDPLAGHVETTSWLL